MRSIEYMGLGEIPPAERNPKAHALGLLILSIGRFGFCEPALLDERTGRLIGGHGRLEAVRAINAWREGGGGAGGNKAAAAAGYDLPADVWDEYDEVTGGVDPGGAGEPEGIAVDEAGVWSAPVVRGWSSADDDEAEALLIALNRLPEAGGWDTRGLAEILGGMDTDLLEVAGYEAADLDAILAEAGALDDAAAQWEDAGYGDESGGALESEPGELERAEAAPAPGPAPAPEADQADAGEAPRPSVRNIVRQATTESRETVTDQRAELRPEPDDIYRQQWGLLVTCLDEADQGRALAELRHRGYRVEPLRS